MRKGILKPSKIIWAWIPIAQCNLNCSYCYNQGKKRKNGVFNYSVKHILECLKPERFGGPVFFAAVASGETLLWDEIIEFTKGMLSYGHVVSYTSNGVYTPTLEKFCNFPEKLKSGLEIDLSLHYHELKRTKKT